MAALHVVVVGVEVQVLEEQAVDPRVVAIGDKDLAHEVDFIADWAVNDYLSVSGVAAALIPLSGAKDFFGNDEVWTEFLLNTSIRF